MISSLSSKSRLARQHGAVMVTVGLVMVVLCMAAALGMETFRLLTSRIQMQNIAEYIAEIALSDYRADVPVNNLRINSIHINNYFLASGGGFPPITVTTGCYTRAANAFMPTAGACILPATKAVHVTITTIGGTPVTKVLAQLFTSANINITTSALSYWYFDDTDPMNVIQYYVTGPVPA